MDLGRACESAQALKLPILRSKKIHWIALVLPIGLVLINKLRMFFLGKNSPASEEAPGFEQQEKGSSMPEASGSGVGLGVMGVADEQDYSTFENRTGLADDMKFLASMPELCDVTFLVGDTREPVCAVKAVLAARSRVFHKMLYQAPSPQRKKEPQKDKLRFFLKRSSEPLLNLQNAAQQRSGYVQQLAPIIELQSNQHHTLIIEEFEPDVFRQLIEYIHTGSVTLQPRTLLGVMNAADYYGLDELRKACAGFVQCCITVDTVCALLASAERYIQYKCTKSLVQKVLEFVDEHGNEVLNLGSFTLLPQHVVRLILAREELRADEFTKFQAALMWSKKYCDSNPGLPLPDVIGNFLEYIQFHKIPATMLMKEVHPLGLVPNTTIMNSLAYQIINFNGHVAQFLDLVAETEPHIIALTETWLKLVHDDSVFSLDNYTIFRRDRNLTHPETGRSVMGGGVACLVHKTLKAKLIHISVSDHVNQPEYLILDVVSGTGNHLLLSVIYRRPQGNLLNDFFDIISKLMTNYKNLIITGDLNCDLLESTYISKHLKSFISELSLYCVSYQATHHSNNRDSWLDVVLLDNQCKLNSYYKSKQPFINGHDYLVCDYMFDSPNKIDKIVTFRSFSELNSEVLSNTIFQSLNIDRELLESLDPNTLLHLFQTNILNALDEFAPLRSRKIVRASNPWVTRELKLKCKKRDSLYKRAKRSKNIEILRQYRVLRKELKVELNRARENYLKNVLSNLPQGTNAWSKLKHLGLVKKSASSPLSYFDASDLNDHFANIVRRHPSCDPDWIDSLEYSHQISLKGRVLMAWTLNG
ncbi:Similar to gprs: Serine-enriched protein (Drosophila melanogaster) [Cotesia congregata]|uniref:Similar to gprs: Serine-enriched protein (Drosophila melanogaster) n=1 Tax=Cotesia congregata TaxID=51543 RepID=A0A8J2EFS3_COTCN|nr:Similar to gprs: Serine-enriched protein (Drosophila melanogaster) [Cotesia congregata]